ncbi:hypothetical protein CNMCM5793_002807 [Aspergillus hiratsukae]|uniref:SHSP domain-containing protein n=1 Tax=Aspergillus hiratsukae TaxID=1194566 RepID=A0A8H6PD57_9EURO|nr:hypothetical protein CNMCM5793_002807 [Aspergillus hiratsukae]KAF7167306.1 hypothetical protein CNMCM6106_002909 [Aspergillus hiratsukae]
MQHSCHFSQHPLAWDISMLEEHPFFAHPHPPPYDDSFKGGDKKSSKCKEKMHEEERPEPGMDDDGHSETPQFGFGHFGGRGGRGFLRHFGPGHLHLHPHEHEHEQENGCNRWTGHEGPGLGHHHHPHHKRGGPGPHFHPWAMIRGLGRGGPGRGRGAGGRCGGGFRHPFYNFHHMHPRFHSFYHSRDSTSFTHDMASFTPPVDIFVTATQTIIHASLPGAHESDLSVAYDASRSILRMAGVVHRPGVDEDMYRALLVGERGRHVGVFEREVPTSHNVAVERVHAQLVHGILRVALPRVEGEVQQHDEEMDEVQKDGAREESWVSSECTIEGKEHEYEEEEEEVEREYVKVNIQ